MTFLQLNTSRVDYCNSFPLFCDGLPLRQVYSFYWLTILAGWVQETSTVSTNKLSVHHVDEWRARSANLGTSVVARDTQGSQSGETKQGQVPGRKAGKWATNKQFAEPQVRQRTL